VILQLPGAAHPVRWLGFALESVGAERRIGKSEEID